MTIGWDAATIDGLVSGDDVGTVEVAAGAAVVATDVVSAMATAEVVAVETVAADELVERGVAEPDEAC